MAPELLWRGHSCFASEFSPRCVACQLVRRIARALVRNYISCGVGSRASELSKSSNGACRPRCAKETYCNQQDLRDDQDIEPRQRQLQASSPAMLITSGFQDARTLVDVASIEG